jgi:TolB protein
MGTYDADDWDDWRDEPPKRRRSCWFVGLALLLVASLIASAVWSAVWLFRETAVSPPPPTSAPAPLPGRVAFIDREGQVMTIDPDGRNGRSLTDVPSAYQFPAWSPDGQRLAVINREAIYLLHDNAEPHEPIVLYRSTRQNPFYLYWSPDGRSLSFLANEPAGGIGLRLVQTDRPYDEQLLATGSPFYWQWLNDGRLLIHAGGSGAGARLAFLRLGEGSEAEESIAPPGQFQTPGISANGRFWAYAEGSGETTSRLVVADSETGEQWTLRHTGMVALSWSPVGSKLAFSNGLDERMATFWGPLRLLDAETGQATILSDDIVLGFFWSPNGRYLATIYTGDNNRSSGIIADQSDPSAATPPAPLEPEVTAGLNRAKETGRPLPLARLNAQRPVAQFRVAVINIETGEFRELAAFAPTRLFVGQFLPFFDQYALSHRLWSPDSAAIVLPVIENGVSRVKVFPINGDPSIDLGRGDMPFWSP